MKRLLIIMLAALLLLSAVSCGDGGNEVSETPSDAIDITTGEPPEEPPSPSESADPTGDVSDPSEDVTDPSTNSGRDPVSELTYEADGESVTTEAVLVESDLGLGGRLYYSMYLDSETLYTQRSADGKDTFTRALDSSMAGLVSMELRLVEADNASSLAPSYLDGYIDYTDIEFSGKTKITENGIYAQTATASNSDSCAEAYLIDVASGVLAVVLSYPLELSESYAPLMRGMLYTLELF